MPPKTMGRPRIHKYPVKKDFVRDTVIRLMKSTGAKVAEISAATGLSTNSLYYFIKGQKSMRSNNSTKVVAFLEKKARRLGSPSVNV